MTPEEAQLNFRNELQNSINREYVRKKENQRRLGDATLGFANTNLMQNVAPNTYNAKTLPYEAQIDGKSTKGLALKNYGIDGNNIIEKIDLARTKYYRGDKSGGHKEIYENMLDWGAKNNPKLANYLETGNAPEKGLTRDNLLEAYDFALRESAKNQQTKVKFLDSPIGKIVGTLATIGASQINPFLGAAVGGYRGSRNDGDLFDIARGAAVGYNAANPFKNAFDDNQDNLLYTSHPLPPENPLSLNSIVEDFGNYRNVSRNLNLSPPPKQEESNPFLTYSGDTQNYQGYTNNFLEPSLNAATNYQQRVAQEEAAEIAEREQSENLIDRFTNVSNVLNRNENPFMQNQQVNFLQPAISRFTSQNKVPTNLNNINLPQLNRNPFTELPIRDFSTQVPLVRSLIGGSQIPTRSQTDFDLQTLIESLERV